MTMEDEIFNQLVRLDVLDYEESCYPHECTCCGETTEPTYKLKEYDGISDSLPYIFICNDCYKQAREGFRHE